MDVLGVGKIVDWLLSQLGYLLPFYIVFEFQRGVKFRFGKVRSDEKMPGIHWKLPWVDHVITETVVEQTLNLPAQSLITKDKKSVACKGLIKFEVSDVVALTCNVLNCRDAMGDITCAEIKQLISQTNFQDVSSNVIDRKITKKIKHIVKFYGINILKITLTDVDSIRSLRIFNEQHPAQG